MKVAVRCEYCGKEFLKFPSRIKDGKKNYCSYECANHGKEVTGSYLEKICQTCGKAYKTKRLFCREDKSKYCSRDCMDKGFKKTRKGSGNPLWVGRVKTTCAECGKDFLVRQSALDLGVSKFCGAKCKYKHHSKTFRGKNHWNWKHGKYINQDPRWYGKDWKDIAESVRKRDNYTCQICGKKQFFRKPDVHHKKPFRQFNGDAQKANQLSNLITLCPSCHKIEDAKIREKT